LIQIQKLRNLKQEVPESLLGLETGAKAVMTERAAGHKQIAEAVSNKYPEARELIMGVQMPSASSAETPKAAPGGVRFLGFEK